MRISDWSSDVCSSDLRRRRAEYIETPAPRQIGGRCIVTELREDDINARANEKAKKRKAAREKMLADKTKEKGLLIVHTGKGKGKSTAAFGLVFRAMGNGMRVGIVQFAKGKWENGERTELACFGD